MAPPGIVQPPPPLAPPPPAAPLAPPPKAFAVTPGMVIGALAVVLALTLWLGLRWLRTRSDVALLGNTLLRDTVCETRFCLRGPGLEEGLRANRTIVVAWREGCLDDEYRAFLRGLADQHKGEVSVIGAGLAVPASRDPRAFSRVPLPAPDPFPASECELGFPALSVEKGYVSDILSPPATYLFDNTGALIAVWRGGMGPEQRDRLTAWIEGRPYEEKDR